MATANPHLRGIAIAGALALVAVALGMFTLTRQQPSSSAATSDVIVHHAAAAKPRPAAAAAAKPAAKPKPKPKVAQENAYMKAALAANLPRPVAQAFGSHEVVVVTVYRPDSDVDVTTRAEAEAGAALGGAGFVAVDASRDGVPGELTRAFGVLSAPTTLVLSRADYTKPVTQLEGFVDRETVQQAAYNADPTPGAPSSQTAWAQQADALCATAQQKLLALGDQSGRAAALTPKVKAIFAGLGSGLAALTPPAGRAADAKKFVALTQRELGLILKTRSALTKRAPAAAASSLVQVTLLKTQTGAAAMQLGAPSCSDFLTS